jgi:hypothetical protein
MKQLERQGPVRSKGHEAFLGVAMLGHRGGSFHRVKRVRQEAQRLRTSARHDSGAGAESGT